MHPTHNHLPSWPKSSALLDSSPEIHSTPPAVWVSNSSCLSEVMQPMQSHPDFALYNSMELWCFSDDRVNSGILKIRMPFQHTAEGRSLLLSQLPHVSHITLPQTWHKLYSNGLKPGTNWFLLSLSSSGWLITILSCDCAEHSTFCKQLHWNCHTPAQLQPFLGTPGFLKNSICRRQGR